MQKVFVFGDSTTCEYDKSSYPQQGWAHFLGEYFDEDTEIINVAHGGYSLKSFLYSRDYQLGNSSENDPQKSLWADILKKVSAGDYFIFYWGGINDMGQICADSYRLKSGGEFIRDDFFTDKDVFMNVGNGYGTHTFFTLRTTPEETCNLLAGMIDEVKTKGAFPIVAKGTGKYYKINNNEKNVFSACHNFASAVEDAAKITDSPFINIAGTFEEEFSEIGYQNMINKYFMSEHASKKFLSNKEREEKSRTADDNVHYNIDGARRICEIFVEKLSKTDLTLKDHLL